MLAMCLIAAISLGTGWLLRGFYNRMEINRDERNKVWTTMNRRRRK